MTASPSDLAVFWDVGVGELPCPLVGTARECLQGGEQYNAICTDECYWTSIEEAKSNCAHWSECHGFWAKNGEQKYRARGVILTPWTSTEYAQAKYYVQHKSKSETVVTVSGSSDSPQQDLQVSSTREHTDDNPDHNPQTNVPLNQSAETEPLSQRPGTDIFDGLDRVVQGMQKLSTANSNTLEGEMNVVNQMLDDKELNKTHVQRVGEDVTTAKPELPQGPDTPIAGNNQDRNDERPWGDDASIRLSDDAFDDLDLNDTIAEPAKAVIRASACSEGFECLYQMEWKYHALSHKHVDLLSNSPDIDSKMPLSAR